MAEIKIQEFKLMRLYFGQDFLPCPIRTEYDLSFIPKELLFTLMLPFLPPLPGRPNRDMPPAPVPTRFKHVSVFVS